MTPEEEQVLIDRVMKRTIAERKRDGLTPEYVPNQGMRSVRDICEPLMMELHARAIVDGWEAEFRDAVEQGRREMRDDRR